MDRGDMKVQGPEQCQSDLVQGRHDLDCRDQGCRSTTTFLRMTSWQCGRLEKFKTPQFGTFSFSTPSSSLKAATPSSSGRYCHHQIHAMTKTRVGGVKVKIGYVNQKQWLAQGGIAEHSIKTTGAVATKPSWVTRTWISIANGTLKEWQVDYLVSINFPMTKEENDRRRKAFKEAKTARNLVVVTAEQPNLLPSQVKIACGGYKRGTCKHVGGCNKVAIKKGGL